VPPQPLSPVIPYGAKVARQVILARLMKMLTDHYQLQSSALAGRCGLAVSGSRIAGLVA
jgi:hypothetical protein